MAARPEERVEVTEPELAKPLVIYIDWEPVPPGPLRDWLIELGKVPDEPKKEDNTDAV